MFGNTNKVERLLESLIDKVERLEKNNVEMQLEIKSFSRQLEEKDRVIESLRLETLEFNELLDKSNSKVDSLEDVVEKLNSTNKKLEKDREMLSINVTAHFQVAYELDRSVKQQSSKYNVPLKPQDRLGVCHRINVAYDRELQRRENAKAGDDYDSEECTNNVIDLEEILNKKRARAVG